MGAELISVIVPVYNVEPYLDRCIISIVQQTYPNLEIILVDDGSPDGCPEICDSWAEKDDRIRVIHKENGGVSRARNTGLEVATGELVMFVDSDDHMPIDGIENLMKAYWRHGAALTCGSFRAIKRWKRAVDNIYPDMALSENEFYAKAAEAANMIFRAPWAKLYVRQTIRENTLKFPEDIHNMEDAIFFFRYLSCVRTFCITSKIVYFYNMTVMNSAMHRYHKKQCAYLRAVSDEHAEFLRSTGTTDAVSNIQQWEQRYFQNGLDYYILQVRHFAELKDQLEELVQLFPEAANHSPYGAWIRAHDWEKLIRKWKQDHLKIYLYERFKGAFYKVLNCVRKHG